MGKGGSDVAATSEAIGRLVSVVLRMPGPMRPTDRLGEVADQLEFIGGTHDGLDSEFARSLPDAVSRAFRDYLDDHDSQLETSSAIPIDDLQNHELATATTTTATTTTTTTTTEETSDEIKPFSSTKPERGVDETETSRVRGTRSSAIGDLCPECGNSTLLNVEGCKKCHFCGYSKC